MTGNTAYIPLDPFFVERMRDGQAELAEGEDFDRIQPRIEAELRIENGRNERPHRCRTGNLTTWRICSTYLHRPRYPCLGD